MTRELADVLVMVLLGLFLLLFGLAKVTNFQVVWMDPVMGLSALAAGIICLIRAFR